VRVRRGTAGDGGDGGGPRGDPDGVRHRVLARRLRGPGVPVRVAGGGGIARGNTCFLGVAVPGEGGGRKYAPLTPRSVRELPRQTRRQDVRPDHLKCLRL